MHLVEVHDMWPGVVDIQTCNKPVGSREFQDWSLDGYSFVPHLSVDQTCANSLELVLYLLLISAVKPLIIEASHEWVFSTCT